jgi:geranylgeranyl diphosphate synthase type I
MLTYHMGWTGEGAGPEAAGKRIRPLMLLLVNASCGADWQKALPAAAAVELLHNFSLVHDDIQDNSDKRRGRPTVWAKWGVPMAINAGDALFVQSSQALMEVSAHYPAATVVQVATALHDTCLDLTRGQYLDMAYETRRDLPVEEYWHVVGGKTAALLAACTAIGAALGGADEPTAQAYRSFGHYLGLAFQVQDDILGIWGDESLTGKSASSDLVEGKNSLPVLAGLAKSPSFAARWQQGNITPAEAPQLAALLAHEGAYEYAHEAARQMTDLALSNLRAADPQGEPGAALFQLTEKLLERKA